jgi:hypothetical protein
LVALGVIGSAIALFLSRRRRNQRAPTSEYGEHNTQLVDVPPQSPTVPQMTQENHHSAYGAGARASPRRYVSAMFYLLCCISDSVHRTLLIPIHTLLLQLQRRDIHPAVDWHLVVLEMVLTTTSQRFDQAMYHIIQNWHFRCNNATTILFSVITTHAVYTYQSCIKVTDTTICTICYEKI